LNQHHNHHRVAVQPQAQYPDITRIAISNLQAYAGTSKTEDRYPEIGNAASKSLIRLGAVEH